MIRIKAESIYNAIVGFDARTKIKASVFYFFSFLIPVKINLQV
jgi:hypothetical protein